MQEKKKIKKLNLNINDCDKFNSSNYNPTKIEFTSDLNINNDNNKKFYVKKDDSKKRNESAYIDYSTTSNTSNFKSNFYLSKISNYSNKDLLSYSKFKSSKISTPEVVNHSDKSVEAQSIFDFNLGEKVYDNNIELCKTRTNKKVYFSDKQVIVNDDFKNSPTKISFTSNLENLKVKTNPVKSIGIKSDSNFKIPTDNFMKTFNSNQMSSNHINNHKSGFSPISSPRILSETIYPKINNNQNNDIIKYNMNAEENNGAYKNLGTEEFFFDISCLTGKNSYTSKQSNTVKEFSYFQDQNKQFKNKMEDFSKTIEGSNNNFYFSLFTLYDGHGGCEVAKICKDYFFQNLKKYFTRISLLIDEKNDKKLIENIKLFIRAAFIATDENSKKVKNQSGSTGLIVFIIKFDLNKRILFSANIGDTACYLINTNLDCKKVSYDHKCCDNEEAIRVKSCGGHILYSRVMGELMVTRAFGDHKLKQYGVSAEPYIYSCTINKEKFMIMGSDGLWDGINNYDIISNTRHAKSTEELAKFFTRLAINRGSHDNISCITVLF